MSSTRTNRFALPSSTPLRRLRTAFSPSRSRSTSPSSTSTMSPLNSASRNSSPDSRRSSSSINSIRHMLKLRRQPSGLDLELEEEKHLFGPELGLLEPRPSTERIDAGIFEVLEGRVRY